MVKPIKTLETFSQKIKQSGLSIYDNIPRNSNLWIPTRDLEILLNNSLKGADLKGLALRTRSKYVKILVCNALGYPIPDRFIKIKPRFPGQNLDIYNQKSNNLQIWNDSIASDRRYVITNISEDNFILNVKVISGRELQKFDKTGTLTKKYQASIKINEENTELISDNDTEILLPHISSNFQLTDSRPSDTPVSGKLLPIKSIFDKLKILIGREIRNPGFDQERNRGAGLHELVCKSLGYQDVNDTGQFPDIPNQLLEIKLQTSPTIDLGLILPNSEFPLDISFSDNEAIRPIDVRYAIFYAQSVGVEIKLTHFYLTNGKSFFNRFPQFQGKVLNKKLQFKLPNGFFS